MKDIAKDVLFFAIVALGFTTFKIVKGFKSFMKPKVYDCSKCHSQIVRGTGVRIGKETTCINCWNKKI